MVSRIFNTVNGKIKISNLTANKIDEGLNLMKTCFFKDEYFSNICGVSKNDKAVEELTKMAEIAAYDGISVIATNSDDKIIGINITKLLSKNEESVFEKCLKLSKEQESIDFLNFMIDPENNIDLNDHLHKYDSGIEFMFGAIKHEYRKSNIGFNLAQCTFDWLKSFSNKKNIKIGLNDDIILTEPPKFFFAMCTNDAIIKIMKQLDFTILKEVSYEDIYYKGRKFTDILKPNTEKYALATYLL